jgi:hypothetical protein
MSVPNRGLLNVKEMTAQEYSNPPSAVKNVRITPGAGKIRSPEAFLLLSADTKLLSMGAVLGFAASARGLPLNWANRW